MLRRFIAMLTGCLDMGGCSSPYRESLPADQPGSFALSEVESKETPEGILKTWRATSRGGGEPFAFGLEILLKAPKDKGQFAFSKGALIREHGADGKRFLEEVGRAIEAGEVIPTKEEQVDRLEFATAILGTSLSWKTGDSVIAGSFTSSKPGDWIALKLFLADGEGEVYLNINPVIGQGEFATKDPEYGEVVLRELAKVF
jgi:hypothetical protein